MAGSAPQGDGWLNPAGLTTRVNHQCPLNSLGTCHARRNTSRCEAVSIISHCMGTLEQQAKKRMRFALPFTHTHTDTNDQTELMIFDSCSSPCNATPKVSRVEIASSKRILQENNQQRVFLPDLQNENTSQHRVAQESHTYLFKSFFYPTFPLPGVGLALGAAGPQMGHSCGSPHSPHGAPTHQERHLRWHLEIFGGDLMM